MTALSVEEEKYGIGSFYKNKYFNSDREQIYF